MCDRLARPIHRRRTRWPAGSCITSLAGRRSSDLVEAVTKLKQRYERDIVVHGSPQLAQTLVEHDLVDELRLMVYPVIVGAGKRLFAETTDKKNLRLVETKTFNDGVQSLSIDRRIARGCAVPGA
jgi:dihydrofolate reductase